MPTNKDNFNAESSQRLIESQNDVKLDSLYNRASQIKHITLDIQNELDTQNQRLDQIVF